MYYYRIISTFFLFLFITLAVPAKGSDTQNEQLERSRGVVQELYESLLNELRGALKHGGKEEAINVCHDAAQRITDSFQTVEQSVRRVTLQLRNPKNGIFSEILLP
jgi:hypothetical protein